MRGRLYRDWNRFWFLDTSSWLFACKFSLRWLLQQFACLSGRAFVGCKLNSSMWIRSILVLKFWFSWIFVCGAFMLQAVKFCIWIYSFSHKSNFYTYFLFPATVQAFFRLQKPVSQLVPHIGKLEYDINDEIGVPNAKVFHQSSAVM